VTLSGVSTGCSLLQWQELRCRRGLVTWGLLTAWPLLLLLLLQTSSGCCCCRICYWPRRHIYICCMICYRPPISRCYCPLSRRLCPPHFPQHLNKLLGPHHPVLPLQHAVRDKHARGAAPARLQRGQHFGREAAQRERGGAVAQVREAAAAPAVPGAHEADLQGAGGEGAAGQISVVPQVELSCVCGGGRGGGWVGGGSGVWSALMCDAGGLVGCSVVILERWQPNAWAAELPCPAAGFISCMATEHKSSGPHLPLNLLVAPFLWVRPQRIHLPKRRHAAAVVPRRRPLRRPHFARIAGPVACLGAWRLRRRVGRRCGCSGCGLAVLLGALGRGPLARQLQRKGCGQSRRFVGGGRSGNRQRAGSARGVRGGCEGAGGGWAGAWGAAVAGPGPGEGLWGGRGSDCAACVSWWGWGVEGGSVGRTAATMQQPQPQAPNQNSHLHTLYNGVSNVAAS